MVAPHPGFRALRGPRARPGPSCATRAGCPCPAALHGGGTCALGRVLAKLGRRRRRFGARRLGPGRRSRSLRARFAVSARESGANRSRSKDLGLLASGAPLGRGDPVPSGRRRGAQAATRLPGRALGRQRRDGPTRPKGGTGVGTHRAEAPGRGRIEADRSPLPLPYHRHLHLASARGAGLALRGDAGCSPADRRPAGRGGGPEGRLAGRARAHPAAGRPPHPARRERAVREPVAGRPAGPSREWAGIAAAGVAGAARPFVGRPAQRRLRAHLRRIVDVGPQPGPEG